MSSAWDLANRMARQDACVKYAEQHRRSQMCDHEYLMDLLEENERLREERDQAIRDADEYMAKEAQRDREVLDLRAENERLREVERRFSDELGFTDFAEGVGPVYATADQMIEQIRREREQSEEYWDENERLRKVVDAFDVYWFHSTPGMDFTRWEVRPSAMREFNSWVNELVALRELEDSDG